MLVTDEMVKTIKESKTKGQTHVFKDFYNEIPSWQEFIDYIGEASHQESMFPNPLPDYDLKLDGKVFGNVLIKQSFYFYLGTHRHIGNSEKIVLNFQEKVNEYFDLASLYINFSTKIDNVPAHSDPLDNFYWQCHGSVEWKANDKTYLIKPGDLVYIPARTFHAVNFSTPRAAIGFSADL